MGHQDVIETHRAWTRAGDLNKLECFDSQSYVLADDATFLELVPRQLVGDL